MNMPWWMPAAIGTALTLIAALWFVVCIPFDQRRIAEAFAREHEAGAAERKERVNA